jgi:hypothetical protein
MYLNNKSFRDKGEKKKKKKISVLGPRRMKIITFLSLVIRLISSPNNRKKRYDWWQAVTSPGIRLDDWCLLHRHFVLIAGSGLPAATGEKTTWGSDPVNVRGSSCPRWLPPAKFSAHPRGPAIQYPGWAGSPGPVAIQGEGISFFSISMMQDSPI